MDKYIRGGSWHLDAWFSRSAYRYRVSPADRYYNIGFRVVCNCNIKKEGWILTMMKYIRGSSYFDDRTRDCRSAYRDWVLATSSFIVAGFRAASTQPFYNLVHIPAGRFVMGSPQTEDGRYKNEEQREVVIDQPFWMMDSPVTRSLYHEVMGIEFDGKAPDHPMVDVSWHDAIEFCHRFSEQTGRQFMLPTEVQWEYACRAGTTTAYHFGDNPKMLGDYGWYYGNCVDLQPVKQKKPNPWGLYDMHGLVWEWCLDGPDDETIV